MDKNELKRVRGDLGGETENEARRTQQLLLESVVCLGSVCFVCVNCNGSACLQERFPKQ